jgi:hypothetical protein
LGYWIFFFFGILDLNSPVKKHYILEPHAHPLFL